MSRRAGCHEGDLVGGGRLLTAKGLRGAPEGTPDLQGASTGDQAPCAQPKDRDAGHDADSGMGAALEKDWRPH